MSQCMFCLKPGKLRAEAAKEPLLEEDAYACDGCWKLLKDPTTGLRLIRGNLASASRQGADARIPKAIDAFMGKISSWKPRN